MTGEDAETAIRDAGVGWDQPTDGVVLAEVETPGYCNAHYCASVAKAATRSGTSPDDLGLAVLALVEGDDSLLRAILAPP